MTWIAAIDEFASETQISEGWTYAVLPSQALAHIDSAVSQCKVRSFHGKKFKSHQANDYEIFLESARCQLLNCPDAFLTFTLLERSWKAEFVPFGERLIRGAMTMAGISDEPAIKIAEHLFPGLMALQRMTASGNIPSFDIEIDSDVISKKLATSNVTVNGGSLPLAQVLGRAYSAYRSQLFQSSPILGVGGIKALNDAKSRAIQLADVYGNFALAYIFNKLGHASKKRRLKADIFEKVFRQEINPGPIHAAARLAGANDIELTTPGGLSLRIGT